MNAIVKQRQFAALLCGELSTFTRSRPRHCHPAWVVYSSTIKVQLDCLSIWDVDDSKPNRLDGEDVDRHVSGGSQRDRRSVYEGLVRGSAERGKRPGDVAGTGSTDIIAPLGRPEDVIMYSG